jgi:16S rRNA (cytidine1402-2'-O)-methyltransferase
MIERKKGVIYLLPKTLGEEININDISQNNREIINSLDEFIVENERTARRFLKAAGYEKPLGLIKYHILDEHTKPEEYGTFLHSAENGVNTGLLSESGCPCVADPGSQVVKAAHEKKLRVVPLIGPSSIILGLMASGFNGQNFSFHGYLPVKSNERIRALRQIEADIYRKNQTQIFIETPYRNMQLFEDIIKTCQGSAMLCIATDLTLATETIRTKSIAEWKKIKPDINKRPTVFLMYR